MHTIREKENLFQTLFLAALILGKRFYGHVFGEWENLLFIFGAALGLYVIHSCCVRLSADYPEVDDWEEKFNLGTVVLYGVAVFLLQLLNVSNLLIFVAIGVILIALNVLVKTKRKDAIRNYKR